ncbi:MAG TPA: lysophospholipid acyltransferase family protein [Candidatus Krumholzibacteriaceae bacterium]|nr:lysophospholipid acyltransferase family protein [Candidatus Krumholzibacteriaceae bacterium]
MEGNIDNWKRIRHRLELMGVYILSILPRLLPLKVSVRFGAILGFLAFDIFRIRRSVTLNNLKRAFGDRMSSRERLRTGRRSYINFAKSMIEFASIGSLSGDDLRELVSFSGKDYMEEALKKGHGVIAITGHLGSWELMGAAFAATGIPTDFLVGQQGNKFVDSHINRLRRKAGIGTIPVGVSIRGIFTSLKKNRVVAMLSDQDARKAGIFVDFFGIPSSTYPGAAQFACRVNCPIIFCFIVRGEDETHHAVFCPPIQVNPEADREEEIKRLTALHVKALEESVIKYPDQYFWAHKRWKTKPPDK